jgi:ribosomal protein S18 acetylase RimI-like enzyme
MPEIDSSKVSLRGQTSDDLDFLRQLYFSTREAELTQVGWAPAEIHDFLAQQFSAQYHSYQQLFPDAQFQLVEYRGESIGRLYLHRDTEEYRIIDIALLPEYRNRKLGYYLIQNILETAAASETPVSLHVEHLNPAIRLYERLGFARVEDRGLHLFMRWNPSQRSERN